MLSRQITDFTSRRRGGITRNGLTTLVRVQMRQSAIAVSAGWDGLVVNMVGEGTSSTLESTEVDIDNNASAVIVGSEYNLAGHSAVSEESGITIWGGGFVSLLWNYQKRV